MGSTLACDSFDELPGFFLPVDGFFFFCVCGKTYSFDLSVNMQSFIVAHWKESGRPFLDSTFQEVLFLLLFCS